MKETRAGKYGRNLAILIDWMLSKPCAVSDSYKKKFLIELQNYSLTPRMKGSPRNEGTIDELENIDAIDPSDPKHAARVIKQGLHLMYQKNTSRNSLYALLQNL